MVSLTRRWFVTGGALVLAAAAADLEPAPAQTPPRTVGSPDPRLVEDLVAPNRILADQNGLDGYGHVSARHDRDPSRYLMSRSLAPRLVTAGVVLVYDLDSNTVDARDRASYLERFIHGEIYTARPDARATGDNHQPSVSTVAVTR